MTDTPESSSSQIVIYQTEDGNTRLEVRLEQETVWLTQKMMAELFQVSVPTINEHVKNVYREAELMPEATIRKFRIVQKEGQRTIGRMVDFYNLDMIISVGYRVKSHIATRFRQWATQRLREYIVKGFVLDDERLKNPDQPFDYFDELLRRIQNIRTSESASTRRSRISTPPVWITIPLMPVRFPTRWPKSWPKPSTIDSINNGSRRKPVRRMRTIF
jgi:hypothetical protein